MNILRHRDMLYETAENILNEIEKKKVNNCLRTEKKNEIIASCILKRYVFQEVMRANIPEDFSKDEFGKPYIINHSFNFSSSGNNEFVVIGINKHVSIGIDIEKIRRFPGIQRGSFFCDLEYDIAQKSPEDFTRMWTRKEAFLKCIGTGWKIKNDTSVTEDDICWNHRKYHIDEIRLSENCILSICYEEAAKKEKYELIEVIQKDLQR